MDFLICPNRICPTEVFLPNSRPGIGVVTARRQHGTTAFTDDTTAVCACASEALCVCKREQYVQLCEEEKNRESNNKTGSQNVCKSCRQKCQIIFVLFLSDFRLMPNTCYDAVCCEPAAFRWRLWCNSHTTVGFPFKWCTRSGLKDLKKQNKTKVLKKCQAELILWELLSHCW